MDRRDTGKVECRTGGMQYWKLQYRNGGMQERKDERKEGCRKAGVQESMDAKRRDSRDERFKVCFETALIKKTTLEFERNSFFFI